MRKDCPICGRTGLLKLSNHLANSHQLSCEDRQYYLTDAGPHSRRRHENDYYPLQNQSVSENSEADTYCSLPRKRRRMETVDDPSVSSYDDQEMQSRKRMRNEADDEMSTVSNKDIFSSSDEEMNDSAGIDEADPCEECGESSKEMNDSDESEEADPWGVLIHEAASKLRAKYYEFVQGFQNAGFSEIDTKKRAFSNILPELRKELGNVYSDRLQWMLQMKRDPVHKKIMETRKSFIDDDFFGIVESLDAAIKKRKFLLERMLEDRQHFHDNDDADDEDDDEDDDTVIPYELKNQLHYN